MAKDLIRIGHLAPIKITTLKKYYSWAKSVEIDGIRKTRALPGYHDEPLKGDRKGQRSVRLN